MQEFKKLLGQRVYLEVPKKEDSKLIVDENTKEALNRELLKNMSRLKVYAVGNSIDENLLHPGDEVLVDPNKLKDALLVPLSNDKTVMMITVFDIVHIW